MTLEQKPIQIALNIGHQSKFFDRRLRHKHIVMSMGITVDPNTKDVVLVMEYLKHGSLEDFVKKNGPLSAQQQAQIALDVAKGLLYIHSRTPKVIHRDIKPGNILVS